MITLLSPSSIPLNAQSVDFGLGEGACRIRARHCLHFQVLGHPTRQSIEVLE